MTSSPARAPPALAPNETADAHDAVRRVPLLRRAVGGEQVRVHPARRDGDARRGDAELDQLELLVRTRRDHLVDAAADNRLEELPLGGARVVRALVALLHVAERMEGVQRRGPVVAESVRGTQRCDPGHPEVAVHDVGRLVLPVRGQDVAEVGHPRQQGVFRDRLGGAGIHVHDVDAVARGHAFGQLGVVAPGVHLDGVTGPRQLAGQCRDVDVLTARIRPADRGEGAGVL
jgi:hypothetical protein